MVIPPQHNDVDGEVKYLKRRCGKLWRNHEFTELWKMVVQQDLEETLEKSEKVETSTLVETSGVEDEVLRIKSHYLRRKPTFALLSTVLRYIKTLTDGGLHSDKTVQRIVGRVLIGAHMAVAYKNRSTGRNIIVKNCDAISKKSFPRANHQLMYAIAQVNVVYDNSRRKTSR